MKPKWMKALFKRRMMVIIFLILQFGIIFLLMFTSSEESKILNFAFGAVGVFVALYVLSKKDKPGFKLAWIMQVVFFPIYGGLFYLFFNFQISTRKFITHTEKIENRTRPLFGLSKNSIKQASEKCPQFAGEMKYLQGYEGYPVYDMTQATYFPSGETFLESLLEELKKAEKYIFLEFFIIQEGKMWDSILGVLKEKAAHGVDIRVIYDDVGCFFTLPKNYAAILEQYGIRCAVFNPFRAFLSSVQNNRDHRKIVSIDGKVAFTGGINLADEYINAIEKHGHWRDSAVMLKGRAAWSLTTIFLQTWLLFEKEEENLAKLYPGDVSLPADCFVQPYADSPLSKENVGEAVYFNIINSAKDYVYICTPYLIIDDDMLSALSLAAKRGVDIRILTPYKWDKKLVHMTTRSYYRELIDSGVRIYEYSAGFVHSKTFVADDEIATVGTINMDYRSLYLHFECGAVLYSGNIIKDIKNDFLDTIADCAEITKKDCKCGVLKQFGQQILRIFAPLM